MYSFKWLLLSEIPNNEINFRSARIWAYLPSLHPSNGTRSFRMKWKQTKVQRRLTSKWKMVWRLSIQKIQAEYGILFSMQSTTHLNTSLLMKQPGCWMRILCANHQMSVIRATSIQFQACPELSFWQTKFGPSGSSWGDGFRMLICQEHWWRMKLVLDSVSNGSGPSLQVRVGVQTEPLPNWCSGLSINPNCPLGYSSMVNSQPVWSGRVVSGSPSGSIYRFI